MKNSLKMLLGLLLTGVISITTASERIEGNVKDPNDHPRVIVGKPGMVFGDNQHVLRYVPADIASISGLKNNYACNEHGDKLPRGDGSPRFSAGCHTYRSESTNTSWIISFVYNPTSTVRVKYIFKVENNQRILWATFDPKTKANIWASSGAQKFARSNGNNTNMTEGSQGESSSGDIAQIPQPAKENCSGKSFFEKTACELKNAGIENALGTIINKSR